MNEREAAWTKEYTPTTAPQGVEVPQWIESASWQCITALRMLKNQSLTDDDVRGLHAAFQGFIARHAPQPEQPAPAASDAVGVREPKSTCCNAELGYLMDDERNIHTFICKKCAIETDAEGNALEQH